MLRLYVCILALVTQYIQHVFSTQHYIVICGVSWLYRIFPHYRVNGTISEKNINLKVCFDFLYNICVKNFSF